MRKIALKKSFNISPLTLIVSGDIEKYNVMSASSVGLMASEPDIYVVSIKKSRYTVGLIERNNEFTVNIPFFNILDKADYCGIFSGKDRNKVDDVNFRLIKSEIVKPPIIEDCALNFECRVFQKHDVGEWVLFYGEIMQQYVNQELLDEQGNFLSNNYNPILYSNHHESYFMFGEKNGVPGQPSKTIIKNLK